MSMEPMIASQVSSRLGCLLFVTLVKSILRLNPQPPYDQSLGGTIHLVAVQGD
jgi:hypothetical protein